MKEYKLLYQIKALEQLVARLFIYSDMSDSLFHITPTQMQIIKYILKHPKENTHQKDLENILSLRRTTVSGVLKTMEKNNLIEWIIDTNDSRTKKIILNSNAKKIFASHEKIIEEIEKLAVKDIPEEELLQVLKVIKKMQNNLKLVAKEKKGIKNAKIN